MFVHASKCPYLELAVTGPWFPKKEEGFGFQSPHVHTDPPTFGFPGSSSGPSSGRKALDERREERRSMRRSDPMLPFGLFLAQLKLQLPRVTRKAGRLEWRGIRGGQGRLGMVAVVLSVVPDRSPCSFFFRAFSGLLRGFPVLQMCPDVLKTPQLCTIYCACAQYVSMVSHRIRLIYQKHTSWMPQSNR